ncbi:MAG TPA: universal stress protein [Natrialbaceae archaeon]|nr:universal stress protein [Natrialbaceae archaeon]
MFDRILIPVDGSDEANRAARRGLQLAAEFDATVDVLHVVERKATRLTRTADQKTALRERGEEILATVEETAAERGQSITTELLEGSPSEQISDYARDRNAELVVVGRQGMTGLGKRFLGGVTEQLLYWSDVPVLVVTDEEETPEAGTAFSNVLFPTDGSENAKSAIDPAIEIARQYGSTLHVLNVVDLQAAGGVFDAGGLEKEFVERLEEGGKEAVDAVVDEVGETAPDLDVESAVVRTSSFDGAAAGIREYVAEHEVDLVVMGSHGRSNLKRQVLGSVASTLVRSVDVPVLIVRRDS